ncbi:MAG: hypothetical protein EOP38_08145 [Rubrivivax sp.]|nr:MAG: hypothetical protein EOP38_08145 [Rubrivivax sp.]
MKVNPRTLASGSLAGILSMLVLAKRGRAEDASAVAPINAPSHWLFGKKALAQDRTSWRYTATGAAIHHGSALMWGYFYDRLMRSRANRSVGQLVGGAAALTAVAALVDLKLVPERFTPGFEHHLSKKSLFTVYAVFAVGLALGGVLARKPLAKR